MFKKKLLTVAALAFCAAIVTAQTVPTSLVNKATAGLIEDGVIDSLPFGNEDGKGVVFGKYASDNNGNGLIELGWGNAFGDALWLSVYDGFWATADEEKTDSVKKAYGYNNAVGTNGDGVNTDYVDERPRQVLSATGNNFKLQNFLAVGIGINNKIGVQPVWYANWKEYKDVASTLTAGAKLGAAYATIKDDTTDSKTGVSTSKKYDKIKNFERKNTIGFAFKGIGIENDDEVPFYASLKSVTSELNFKTKSNNYSESTDYLGASYISKTADGIDQTITIRPGVKAEVGFNLADWGVVKPNVSFEEDFNIGFDIVKSKTNYTVTTETVDTRKTVETTYELTPGKTLDWKNTLTPALTLNFNLLDNLTLKTKASAAIAVGQKNKAADKKKVVETTTTYTRASGLSTVSTKTTDDAETFKFDDNDYTNQNLKTFTTSVTPTIALGLVYEAIPGKTNLNFGVEVAPGAYTWKTTEKTNANINKVEAYDDKSTEGVSSTYSTVTVQPTNSEETLKKEFDNGDTTAVGTIGATWFFTENAKLDVYYKTNFSNLFGSSGFGVDFAVMF